MSELTKTQRGVISMEEAVVGLLLGGGMVAWGIKAYINHEHLIYSAVAETLMVAIYLTMLVSYVGFKMPVFAPSSPRWSTFWLVIFAGHISLLFDSFAVVMLLATGIVFLPLEGTKHNFNQFAVKVIASFNALTVGGGFYLGELWGLPWFITNGQANIWAGFPILLAATPVSIITAAFAALVFPVQMKKTKFDKVQLLATVEFVLGLILIIVTHSPILCIGVVLVYTALRRKTDFLIEKTLHELKDGAMVALGLIGFAWVLLQIGVTSYIQPWLQGWGMFIGAMLSSPFAGAMAPEVHTLEEFYWGLAYLMLGAPMFVFSSLVAIMVFKDTVHFEDLPVYLRWIPGAKSKGYTQEAILYSAMVVPMMALLAISVYIGMKSGLIVHSAEMLGVTMGQFTLDSHWPLRCRYNGARRERIRLILAGDRGDFLLHIFQNMYSIDLGEQDLSLFFLTTQVGVGAEMRYVRYF